MASMGSRHDTVEAMRPHSSVVETIHAHIQWVTHGQATRAEFDIQSLALLDEDTEIGLKVLVMREPVHPETSLTVVIRLDSRGTRLLLALKHHHAVLPRNQSLGLDGLIVIQQIQVTTDAQDASCHAT